MELVMRACLKLVTPSMRAPPMLSYAVCCAEECSFESAAGPWIPDSLIAVRRCARGCSCRVTTKWRR